jgi:hypothetical protein
VHVARTIARAADERTIALIDEFGSCLDRLTARIASAATAKAVRRHRARLVAVTCHDDVLDWLEPDWVYEPLSGEMWRRDSPQSAEGGGDEGQRSSRSAGVGAAADGAAGDGARACGEDRAGRGGLDRDLSRWGRLRRAYRRPGIELEVFRATGEAWELFKPHHYLSGKLHRSAQCFVGTAWGRPAGFVAVLPFPHPTTPSWREHRCVCLPEFQGVGIGNAMSEFVASLFAGRGKPYTSVTGHPAMIAHRRASPLWRMTRAPAKAHGMGERGTLRHLQKTMSVSRITAGFRYIGPAREAERLRLAEKAEVA